MRLPTVSSHTSSAHLRRRKEIQVGNGTKRVEKGGRRTGKERRKETSGFHRQSVASWRLCRGTGGLGPLRLSRRFRGSFGKFGSPHSELMQVAIKYKHQGLFPLVPKFHNHRPPCHEEKTKMSFRDLSRSKSTFAIFREPAFPFRKSARGQLPD